MKRLLPSGRAIAGLILLVAGAAAAAAPPVPAFTAHYRVLQGASPIGQATLTLVPDNDGSWTFTTESRGTAGLASLLGASIREVSRFRWVGDLPQGIRYDYRMDSALKNSRRKVRFDWTHHTIEVEDDGSHRFPSQPGALERHTALLAIAAGLAGGESRFALPVAVRDRIETQRYAVAGRQCVEVPAGTFEATRVTREGETRFEAWFATDRLPVPVKIERNGKHALSLELESWSPQS